MLHNPIHDKQYGTEHEGGNRQLEAAWAALGGSKLVEEVGGYVMVFIVHGAHL